MDDILLQIKDAVITRKKNEIEGLVKTAIEGGTDPNSIIEDSLIAAMDVVGQKFASSEIFVPEMLVSALTMKLGLEVVKPHLKTGEGRSRGTIIMGTVHGDLHDIGKNIVIMMLEGAGFKVVDMGVDLTVEKLIEQLEAIQPDVLGLSALLTTTMPEMERTIHVLSEKGLREKVKIMVGGAPVDQSFADRIGADGYGADATEAVQLARQLIAGAR
ncbi:MAG: corrinoid protein [Proteobacteria bacterium]|nr:corrinoid protein [Desulfobacterales bacterium]MBL6967887.1 corrinoid protein [Desulfobacteraceae bacterium]MBL7101161.1 corrinoid protein [Desulfobacteraceae bacterium]MBL7173005.1 corrinoid protein [Desulfobacteraceae bacterium]MBU1905177.1 corrinoid protein [Pseudomonadota bacterium]